MAGLANLLPGGVLILNGQSQLVAVNRFAESLLGYAPDELLGRRIDSLLTVASRIYYQTHIYPLLTLGTVANELYLTLLTRHRVSVPVLLNACQIEQDGQLCSCLLFIPVYQRQQYEQQLLTARKTAEEALLRNDELVRLQNELQQHQVQMDSQMSDLRQRKDELEQFAKIVAHDLQEPLRKIGLFAGMLAGERPDAFSSMGQTALAGVINASGRLRQLIGDLQTYFTLSSSGTSPQAVDLTAVLQQVGGEYAQHELLLSCSALPTVLGNLIELTTLFRHLLSNCVKFRQSDQPAQVTVEGVVLSRNRFRAMPDKYHYTDYARITVSDRGIGFHQHARDEVFRILKKLHPNTPGLGLGLAVAKKIVEHHHGAIEAESEVGKGTRIIVWLPVG